MARPASTYRAAARNRILREEGGTWKGVVAVYVPYQPRRKNKYTPHQGAQEITRRVSR